jgi:cobalt-zinc-cadmium efflux system membrane fusion protein
MKFHPLALACVLPILTACDVGKLMPSAAATPPAQADAPALVRHGALTTVPAGSPLRLKLVVAEVAQRSVERPVSAPGNIEAVPEKLVSITAPLAGRIVAIQRSLGDSVRQGDALFTLDSADLSAAYGEASKNHAALLQARQELDRQKLLLDADIAAHKDYEAAQLSYAQAESDDQVASSRLAQLGAARGAAGRRYVLRSPIAGRVIEMEGAQGGYWNDINAPVMKVADLSTVFLSAQVAEKDIGAVFAGQKAHIALSAYPGQAIDGTVKYVGELLDPETRTVKVRVAVDNRDGRLRPGMFARVVFAGQAVTATVVPASALLQGGLSTRVYVEKARFSYEPRNVTVGAALGDGVEILAGLRPGERIVVREGVLLND